jgi:hypothetical protein
MKKALVVIALSALLFNLGYAQKPSKADAKKAKEEEKKVKDELKNYMKHPEAYKAKMDAAQADKDSADAQIARLKGQLKASQDNEAELQKKVAAADEQTKTLQEENTKLNEAVTAAKDADMKSTPTKGTVYKVQLGMYRGFNINKYFDQARYLGYEEVDGMNRYVISYFPDQETALKFVADIRKLGIHQAFVAKYIDGQRVYEWSENPKYKGKKVPDSLEDALGGSKPAKKGKHVKEQAPE